MMVLSKVCCAAEVQDHPAFRTQGEDACTQKQQSANMSRGLFLITSCLCSLFFYRSTKAQFVPNVPVEIRSLDEIYSDAQREQCDLRVVGGGDGKAHSSCIAPCGY